MYSTTLVIASLDSWDKYDLPDMIDIYLPLIPRINESIGLYSILDEIVRKMEEGTNRNNYLLAIETGFGENARIEDVHYKFVEGQIHIVLHLKEDHS